MGFITLVGPFSQNKSPYTPLQSPLGDYTPCSPPWDYTSPLWGEKKNLKKKFDMKKIDFSKSCTKGFISRLGPKKNRDFFGNFFFLALHPPAVTPPLGDYTSHAVPPPGGLHPHAVPPDGLHPPCSPPPGGTTLPPCRAKKNSLKYIFSECIRGLRH